MLAIETRELTKLFGANRWPQFPGWRRAATPRAVDSVNLRIDAGQIFGLLGPNGAGKTTLIKMLSTLIEPTSGHARVNGFDVTHESAQIRAAVGLVTSDERSFYGRLSGRENLHFFAALHNFPSRQARARAQKLLEQVELTEHADRAFQTYSTGMRQRLALARGLLHDPSLVFLDEPTRGLDPSATAKLHSFITDELVGRQRKTVWLTTQRLDEAENLCHTMAIMDHGKIRASGTLTELKALFTETARYVILGRNLMPAAFDQWPLSVRECPLESDDNGAGQRIEFTTARSSDALNRVIETIVRNGGEIQDIQRSDSSLESLFTRICGESEKKTDG